MLGRLFTDTYDLYGPLQEAENLIRRLFGWAESAKEPLRSYATGLLASAMEVQDIAANFRSVAVTSSGHCH